MITAIREVRRAKGLTLAEVGERCVPPTTAQTIGRLETGTRTVSVGWLNRIAKALGVEAADLVKLPERADLPVAAVLRSDGVDAPRQPQVVTPPSPEPGEIAVLVEASIGEYRAGDEIWCTRLAPDAFASALNADVLVPRPGGRYVFGRMIGRDETRMQILPLEAGGKQQIFNDLPWIAVATKLVRPLRLS
jgi:transcriptional regulator with XRE-family HTH domain